MQPQKALHLHLELVKKKPKIQGNYIVTEKIDGWYTYADYTEGEGWGAVMSRAGRPIPSMEHVKKELLQQIRPPGLSSRLIMEAYIPATPFSTVNGVFNRSIGDYKCKDVMFISHDLVSFASLLPAMERQLQLQELVRDQEKLLIAKPLCISPNIEDWRKAFLSVVNKGGEGVILKQEKAFYQAGKRNSSLMKIKEELTIDLYCAKLYFTIGKKGNSNMNLLLLSKEGVEIRVRVPKDTDIAEFSRKASYVVGKVVMIKAMKKLPEGTYREPRFVCVRYDKTKGEID